MQGRFSSSIYAVCGAVSLAALPCFWSSASPHHAMRLRRGQWMHAAHDVTVQIRYWRKPPSFGTTSTPAGGLSPLLPRPSRQSPFHLTPRRAVTVHAVPFIQLQPRMDYVFHFEGRLNVDHGGVIAERRALVIARLEVGDKVRDHGPDAQTKPDGDLYAGRALYVSRRRRAWSGV